MKAKGFRQIDNDTFKALIVAGLSGAGYQVVLTIIDRTLGFRKGSGHKEKASIPLAYFMQETGLSRQSVRLGIKQAEKRQIIIVERDSTRTSIYALNLDTGEWITRKPNHPSLESKQLGNQITLDCETKSPQTRKLAIASYMRAKETLKETPKERVTTNITNSLSITPLRRHPHILESHDGTYQERISKYLKAHGPASIKTIAHATGIKANSVNLTLHNGKDKVFTHPQRGKWALKDGE